ncbi:MAG: transposase [bacterium]|nr:transposase [bacterium]MCP4436904.1 transposase [Actinomycetes bacterium]
MPTKNLSQTSFFTPEFADPRVLAPASLPWLFRTQAAKLYPDWLFSDWHGHGRRGRDAWPASVLMTTLLLRFSEEGMSRKAMVRRLGTDLAWRAATGLEIGGKAPSESSFRRFERYLLGRDLESGVPRYQLLHEHHVRMCVDAGIVSPEAVWAMDSTPMWCYGAARGTVRLLGDGLRGLGKQWARAKGQTLAAVATAWKLPFLLAKSTKGHFRINWRDADARAGLIDSLAADVLRVIEQVRAEVESVRHNKRKGLLRRCRQLAKVIADDLEVDDSARLRVAQKVARDRTVSITDPMARHSRKTRSQPFRGFKVHLLGEVVSGLITSLSVTPANKGDGTVALRLIGRAKQLHADLSQVLGDTAYGGAELHLLGRRQHGVDVLAPPLPVTRPKDRFNSTDFDIDVAAGTAKCPGGVEVAMRQGKTRRYFSWSKASCDTCPLRGKCLTARATCKTVAINPRHEELIVLRERWEREEIREQYRTRSQCERLVNQVVRHGGRQARAWGLQQATLQASVIVMRCNLGRLARHLAKEEEPVDLAAA